MTLTLLYHLNVVGEIDVSQVLDDDVKSFVPGEVHQLLLISLVVVVEYLEITRLLDKCLV